MTRQLAAFARQLVKSPAAHKLGQRFILMDAHIAPSAAPAPAPVMVCVNVAAAAFVSGSAAGLAFRPHWIWLGALWLATPRQLGKCSQRFG